MRSQPTRQATTNTLRRDSANTDTLDLNLLRDLHTVGIEGPYVAMREWLR